ncbi:MAG: DUF962 domain-containing protein [Spirochaetales bacterium]|nr:DUF962 domain-containing protein [Leptospiraceae bacterium]MCP5480820.1 DUF962 domain-containing protein [Spirochaetales bacterium]
MSEGEQKITSMREFWPFYLNEHANPTNRLLHYIGSTLVLGVIAAGILVNPWLLLLAPVVGYGFAWVGHFFIEKNRPATFTYPFRSLLSDWIMYGCMLTGRIGRELEKAGVPARGRESSHAA